MVHSPYTAFFGDAFMACHLAIGVVLLALAWWTFPRWNGPRTIFFASIVLVMTTPVLGDFLRGLGGKTAPLTLERDALLLSSCLIFAAMIWLRRFAVAAGALGAAILLLKIQGWVEDSMLELCALHLIWNGVALGLVRRRTPTEIETHEPEAAHGKQDLAIFAIATSAAAIASTYVLSRADGSADEWAYTWQSAVFAKAHIFGTPPPCENAFQNFYVFESVGKMFVQYTPGWPYFMTPFTALGVPWLAGPFSHGLMALGVTRLARSAVRLDGHGASTRVVAAGWIAGLVATFGTTILITGASRYSHVFVAALFAWAIEAILVLASKDLPKPRQVRWGIVLGSCVALMGAARPADGATLSVGLALYFLWVLVRRRVGARAFLATLGAFVFWGGLTLVILRVQLGEWFTTGYSLDKIIHPWAVAKYGWPHPGEWKFGLPLATGSYAWFPCSLAVGFAGIASLRGRARGIIVMMVVGLVCFDTYYQYIALGRGFDWGYGPRYEIPFVVPMGVGMGVALAPLAESALRRASVRSAFHAGGPFAVAVVMMVVTTLRLWPLLYPGFYAHVRQHDSLNERIREMGLHDAVVIAQLGTTGFDALDLTENLPLDLYPHQDVLIAIERTPEFARCVRQNFPDRTIYRASGNPVVITPY